MDTPRAPKPLETIKDLAYALPFHAAIATLLWASATGYEARWLDMLTNLVTWFVWIGFVVMGLVYVAAVYGMTTGKLKADDQGLQERLKPMAQWQLVLYWLRIVAFAAMGSPGLVIGHVGALIFNALTRESIKQWLEKQPQPAEAKA